MHWMHRCAENKCALSKRLKLSPPTSGLRKLSVPDWRTSHREDQTGSATTAVRWEVDDWRITDAVVTQRRRLADSARTGIEAFPRLTPSLENTHDLRHKSRSPPNAGAPEFHDERIFLKFPLQWTLGHTATVQTQHYNFGLNPGLFISCGNTQAYSSCWCRLGLLDVRFYRLWTDSSSFGDVSG